MARTGIIHGSGHFETGDLTGFGWEDDSNEPEVVSSGHPQRAGVYSARFRVDADAEPPEVNYRTEIIVQTPDTCEPDAGSTFKYAIGNEYWIGFSIFVPADWIPQADDVLDDVFLNVQATPDSGEDWRQPILMMSLRRTDWKITSRWDYGAYTEAFDGGNTTLVDFDDVIGHWTDFVIHVEWNATDDSNGFLKVWINGNLEVDRTGPNCSNDVVGPQHQAGNYAWYMDDEWAQPDIEQRIRIYYIDELRIGDDTASYADVKPGALPGVITMIV